MALEIMSDERVRGVEWRDLCSLERSEVVHEVLISLPWLLASWGFAVLGIRYAEAWWAYASFWPLALASSFMFFLCGLRQVHNAFHYAVGITRRQHEWLMWTLSVLMMSAMHAVQYNHLQHHRHCMDDEDVEAMSARMPGWKALLLGPRFPWLLHKTAWQKGGPKIRGWMAFELAAIAVWTAVVFLVLDVAFLKYHVVAMTVGQSFSAFFAVWTVHHDCDRSHYIARTIRDRIKATLTYNMFYHVEHHLYPAVPTCHLPELARRLDDAAPELQSRLVF